MCQGFSHLKSFFESVCIGQISHQQHKGLRTIFCKRVVGWELIKISPDVSLNCFSKKKSTKLKVAYPHTQQREQPAGPSSGKADPSGTSSLPVLWWHWTYSACAHSENEQLPKIRQQDNDILPEVSIRIFG